MAAKHQDASQQSGDPVADAARKAREQKKAEAKPKRVFTNDDVAPAPAPAPPASAATDAKTDGKEGDAAAKPADGNATDAKADKPLDEAGWRKRFSEQRAKISQAEQELDILQRESTKLQTQYYNDPQKALAEQYTRKDITDQDAKIQAKKDQIAKLKQGALGFGRSASRCRWRFRLGTLSRGALGMSNYRAARFDPAVFCN